MASVNQVLVTILVTQTLVSKAQVSRPRFYHAMSEPFNPISHMMITFMVRSKQLIPIEIIREHLGTIEMVLDCQ